MSHHATHHNRRNLAPPDPTKTTTISSAAKPHPDPLTSATIQHISNHFSKLYTTHKQLSSLKPKPSATGGGYPHPSVDAISHTSAPAPSLTKSHSQRSSRPNMADELGKKQGTTRGQQRLVKVKKLVKEIDEGQEIKREILNEGKKLPCKQREFEGGLEIIKKPYALPPTTTNQESDEMKRQSFSSSSASASSGVIGGRRKSFCSTQAELANFLSCNGVKIVSVDMPPFMQIHAVDCARKTHDSLEKFTAKTLALTLKKEFDGVYGPAWHCIVGTSFGSFVTHSVGGFLYFSMDQKHYVLLFKTTVQKAS